jgi:hypothetical protein
MHRRPNATVFMEVSTSHWPPRRHSRRRTSGSSPFRARDITIPALTDADLQQLIATLDSLLARETDSGKWLQSVRIRLWRFSELFDHGLLMRRRKRASSSTSTDSQRSVPQGVEQLMREVPKPAARSQ